MTADSTQTDRLDLQTVIFKCLMDINNTAAKVKLGQDMAFNYYAQIRNLISLVRPIFDQDAIDKLNAVIINSQKIWKGELEDLEEEGGEEGGVYYAAEGDEGGDEENSARPLNIAAALNDVNDHTFFCAVKLLAVTMDQLDEKGIIRTQKKGSLPGQGVIDATGQEAEVTLRNHMAGIGEEILEDDQE